MVEHYEAGVDVTSPIPIMECIVVTPEATALQMPAEFIALPLYDGEMGIAPGHSPFIGRLGYGELRVREDGRTVRLYIDGGFVQVANDQISILTQQAIPVEKLDAGVAREHLASAGPQGGLAGTDGDPRSGRVASTRSVADGGAQHGIVSSAGCPSRFNLSA